MSGWKVLTWLCGLLFPTLVLLPEDIIHLTISWDLWWPQRSLPPLHSPTAAPTWEAWQEVAPLWSSSFTTSFWKCFSREPDEDAPTYSDRAFGPGCVLCCCPLCGHWLHNLVFPLGFCFQVSKWLSQIWSMSNTSQNIDFGESIYLRGKVWGARWTNTCRKGCLQCIWSLLKYLYEADSSLSSCITLWPWGCCSWKTGCSWKQAFF